MVSVSQSGPPEGQQPPPGWGPPPPPGWGTPPPPGWGAPPSPEGGSAPPPGWNQPSWAATPEAPKPGSIPLRPLGVGDILEGTFAILRRHPGATFGASALVVGVVSIVQVLLLVPVLSRVTPVLDAAATGDADAVTTAVDAVSWGGLAVAGLGVGMLSFALFVLLSGLLAVVVGQSAIGRPFGFADAWRRAAPRLLRLLGGVVLVGLLVAAVWVVTALLWVAVIAIDAGLGYATMAVLTLFGAVPLSIYLGVKVSLTTPAIALESTASGPIGPLTGLRRSWTLVSGAWWRTLGILLLAAIIAGALSQVVTIPLSIVLSAAPLDPGAAIVTSTIAAGVGQAISLPISGLILGLVYVDRRMRTEQLDVALARAAGVELPPGGQYR